MNLINSLKFILNEAVGVPDGLYSASEDVYKLMMDFLNGNINPNDTVGEVGTLNWEIYGEWKIADLDIEIINLVLQIEDYNKILFQGMILHQENVHAKLPNVITPINKEIKITIRLGGPIDAKFSEIIDFLRKEKNEFVSSIAHELKHAYDFYKKGEHRVEKYIEYGATQQHIVGLRGIVDFIYASYYLHEFENLVRPSELYSYLMSAGVTKESFLDGLKNNRMIQHLKDAKSLNYEELFDELKGQISNVYTVIKKIDTDFDKKSATHETLVDFLLFLVRKTMINNRLDKMEMATQPSPAEELFSALTGQKTQGEILFYKFMNKLTSGGKYITDDFDIQKTPKLNEEFFTKKIKQINFEADRMYKKIAKIYDLLPSVNDGKQTLNKKINMKPQKEGKVFEFITDEIGTKEYVDSQLKQGKIKNQFNIKSIEEISNKRK